MMNKLERKPGTMSISSFHEQNEAGKFNYSPPYQRKSVWSDEKQSYFIDSILRNFPIPPIFLHRIIDQATGKTRYDVIDGKQRLTALHRFIKGEIPAASEYSKSALISMLDGKYFSDLSSNELSSEKNYFWKYDIPVEYIDPDDIELIEEVFDRLNRNGEPLNGQELRNSQYHSSRIISAADIVSRLPYLTKRLASTDLSRMEDKEFASECLLSAHLGQVIGSSQRILDEFYNEKHDEDFDNTIELCKKISCEIESLELDYDGLRISGVSHIYGLWGLGVVLNKNGKSIYSYRDKLNTFFVALRDQNSPYTTEKEEYRKSMASRTKEKAARTNRVKSLLSACGEATIRI